MKRFELDELLTRLWTDTNGDFEALRCNVSHRYRICLKKKKLNLSIHIVMKLKQWDITSKAAIS